MRRIVAGAFAAAILSLPSPAAAASPGIDRIYAAGRCIVQRDRNSAIDLVLALPLGREQASIAALAPSLAQRCGAGLESVPAMHLRGAIAQALFFRDFRGMGLQPSRSVPLVNLDVPVQDSPAGDSTTEIYRLADCVVRNDGPRTERLLATRPGTENEGRVMDALAPYLRACTSADSQLSIARSDLRSAIAQSAYHSMYRYWTRQLTSVHTQ
jgi:hypothetical protein